MTKQLTTKDNPIEQTPLPVLCGDLTFNGLKLRDIVNPSVMRGDKDGKTYECVAIGTQAEKMGTIAKAAPYSLANALMAIFGERYVEVKVGCHVRDFDELESHASLAMAVVEKNVWVPYDYCGGVYRKHIWKPSEVREGAPETFDRKHIAVAEISGALKLGKTIYYAYWNKEDKQQWSDKVFQWLDKPHAEYLQWHGQRQATAQQIGKQEAKFEEVPTCLMIGTLDLTKITEPVRIHIDTGFVEMYRTIKPGDPQMLAVVQGWKEGKAKIELA